MKKLHLVFYSRIYGRKVTVLSLYNVQICAQLQICLSIIIYIRLYTIFVKM